MSEIIMVYITIPSEEKAKEIARVLLEKRLIACATMLPCKSMYWWDGAIQDDQELIMFAKTTEEKLKLLTQEVINIHPYQIPCIMKIDVSAYAPYARWLHGELDSL